MKDKIRVLHILPSLGKGGAERLVLNICSELLQNPEFEVKLITFREENKFKDLSKNINREVCNSKYIPSIFGKSIVEIENLKKVISEYKPDIIHSHLFESEIVSRKIIYPDIIYITHLHDNMIQFQNFSVRAIFNKKLAANYYEKLLMLKKYRECKNNFIAISNDTNEYFTNCLPRDLQRITLIHNAINFEFFFNPGKKSISKDQKINLVSIGSLVEKKNQIFLVDIVKILIDKGYNVHLDILGEGINRAKIENKINNYNLNQSIHLRGNVDNVAEYLKNSSIYLHSATYEPFGLVLIEAMAAGLPCIALDGKGNRDIIVNETNGFMISDENTQLFAEKIIYLIKNPDLYGKMSESAKEFSKKYDIKKYVNTLLEYYKNLLAK